MRSRLSGVMLWTTLACSAALAVVAAGDSVYKPKTSRSMFADRRAHVVGDVLTVAITESTTAVEQASTGVDKKLEAQASGGSGLFGIFKLVPKASLGGSTTHQGTGNTSRTSQVTSTIACRVTEVTAAGQLMLSGERAVKVNHDTQTVRFTGVARPEDVSPDNTIVSGLVADAKIEILGKGPIDQHSRPGILTKVFEFLF